MTVTHAPRARGVPDRRPVLASARPPAPPPPATAHRPWFRLRRLPGRIGALEVGRLLLFQVTQIGLLLLVVRGVGTALLGGLVCLLVLVLGFGRWHGRWLTTWIALWWRFRQRRGLVSDRRSDPRLLALGQLVPDLDVRGVPAVDDPPVGFGSDGAGWFMVLEVPGPPAGAQPPVPLAALARIAGSFEQPGAVVQVLSQSVPATDPGPEARGEHGAAKTHTLWVAVRLDAAIVADSLVDRRDPSVDIPTVLGELTRRVGRALRRRGLPPRSLDPDELLTALTRACDLAPGQTRSPERERWRSWRSDRLVHRCFWLRTWPDPVRGTELLAALAELPGAWVSTALLLTGQADGAGRGELRCLIRIAAAPEQWEQICGYAVQLAERMGGELFPLDGEHALGVYATAPTGGGAL